MITARPKTNTFYNTTKLSSHCFTFKEENPHCALTFYWAYCNRSVSPLQICFVHWLKINFQVRIEGVAEKLPFSDADQYFKSRPYQSQIGALCSDQSKPIKDRNVLADKERELKGVYGEGEVPRPPQWY